ncbi:MAG: CopG family ribbon-helix-helix protein, partial [Gammaproteobacteria bacterium]
TYRNHFCASMGNISLRLPDDLAEKLDREAERGECGRSEILREALENYLNEKERTRFMEDMVREAHSVYSDPHAARAAQQVVDEFLPVENEVLDRIETAGSAGKRSRKPPAKWWK